VHELFVHQVPIPQSISDREAQAWVEEVKQALLRSLNKLEHELRPDRAVQDGGSKAPDQQAAR
jgi:hypothetical protein